MRERTEIIKYCIYIIWMENTCENNEETVNTLHQNVLFFHDSFYVIQQITSNIHILFMNFAKRLIHTHTHARAHARILYNFLRIFSIWPFYRVRVFSCVWHVDQVISYLYIFIIFAVSCCNIGKLDIIKAHTHHTLGFHIILHLRSISVPYHQNFKSWDSITEQQQQQPKAAFFPHKMADKKPQTCTKLVMENSLSHAMEMWVLTLQLFERNLIFFFE